VAVKVLGLVFLTAFFLPNPPSSESLLFAKSPFLDFDLSLIFCWGTDKGFISYWDFGGGTSIGFTGSLD